MSSLIDNLDPKKERAKKCAQVYFMMMKTDGVAPKLSKAMIQAGYSPRTASVKQKEMVQNKAFRAELERLELEHFDYQKALEKVRNKSIKVLEDRTLNTEKTRDIINAANITNEMLRLERGQSTQNVAIAEILNDLEQS